MIRRLLTAALLLGASAAIAQPPLPPYQMREPQQAGDRHAKGRDAKAAFEHTCGTCHLAGGMGSNLLTVQMLAQKRPPSDGLLTNRQDLYPDYVKAVVRNGKGAMPAQTRVDLTDSELDQVAAYLAKGKK